MVSNGAYVSTEFDEYKQSECNENDAYDRCDNNYNSEDKNTYSYDEAIALTGNGSYNIGLLLTLSLALLAMTIDMFSFSVIVALSSCEFHLDLSQKSVLISMPFLGPISMAYFWGYISDTRGRKTALTFAMAISYFMSSLCAILPGAIAPHWIALAIFKLIGTCFCSCAQSVAFALLGESCGDNVRGTYMLGMTGVLNFSMGIYFSISYAVISLDFSYLIPGFMTFLPWRLLTLILAFPIGICALSLLFFYESPKFLLNAGRHDEALELLKKICKRNGLDPETYPVKKLVLTEVGNVRVKEKFLLKSMWDQTVPLFRPPLLQNTMLIYYLIIVIYASSNSLFVWLPFLSKAISEGIQSNEVANGLCGFISQTAATNATNDNKSCNSSVELPIVIFACITGVVLCSLNILISFVSSRKKALSIILFLISSLCCIGAVHIPNNITNIVMYLGVVLDSLLIGVAFSYCVDLYPTSFRGMASCFGVMVARLSSVAGVNLVGPYIMTHCYTTFYSLAALILSGAVVAYFLPPDRPKKA